MTRGALAGLKQAVRRLALRRPPQTMEEAHRRYLQHPPSTLAEAMALFAPWQGQNIPFRFVRPRDKH